MKYPLLSDNSNQLITRLCEKLQAYTGTLDEDMWIAMFLNPVVVALGFPLLAAYSRHDGIDFIDADLFRNAQEATQTVLRTLFVREPDQDGEDEGPKDGQDKATEGNINLS